MARIDDPNQGAPVARGTTQMTATAEELVGQPVSASQYARETEARRLALQNSKGQGRPLGGAPPIPPGKMSQLVTAPMPQPDFGVEEQDETLGYVPPQRTPLPAQPSPSPIGGVGSGYAVNQAIARGEVAKPVSLAQAKKLGAQAQRGPLSAETVQLLEMQKHQAAEQESQPESGQAQQFDEQSNRQNKLNDSEREIAEDNKIDPGLLPLDMIAQLRNDIIFDDARRKALEAELEPLDITDLVTRREIQQTVPSVPGKIEYTLRTLNEQDHLFCLQYVYEFPGSARYVEELLNMCRLVCSFVALNGKMLPDHRKSVGKLDEEVDRKQFDKKLKLMTLYPTNLVADVAAQYHWFVERVNKLFDVRTLKNG